MESARATRESSASVMTRAEAGLPGIIKEEKNLVKATARMIAELVKGDIVVPPSFPFGLAHELEAFGRVIPDKGTVESLREIKSPGEIEQIRRVQAATELAMDLAISLIRASVPKDGVLYSGGESTHLRTGEVGDAQTVTGPWMHRDGYDRRLWRRCRITPSSGHRATP